MEKKDELVRRLAANGEVIAIACSTRGVAETARQLHDSSPIATAALGRLMSGCLMMSDLLRNKTDALTLMIEGNGPLGKILATGDNSGNVKGYCSNSSVYLPNEANGHLNVAGGIGKGTLTVIKDQGMKDNYNSTIALHSGEIADDLTYYYAQSEQLPSSVGLGVLVTPEGKALESGGFLLQLMPFPKEEVVRKLEENIAAFGNVTDHLRLGEGPDDILDQLLKGFDQKETHRAPVRFYCDCNRERGKKILQSLGKSELILMLSEKKPVEMTCGFCGKKYAYSREEVEDILSKAEDKK